MDLSKLPRLSKSAPPPPEAADVPEPVNGPSQSHVPVVEKIPCRYCNSPVRVGASFCDTCGAQLVRASHDLAGGVAEAWISVAVGVILLWMFPNFIRYLSHPHDTSALDATDLATGAIIPYVKSAFVWSDAGVALFSVVLLLDAAVILFFRTRPLLVIALAMSAVAAAFNLWAVIRIYPIVGFPIQCGLAVAFSIYIAIVQLQMLRDGTR